MQGSGPRKIGIRQVVGLLTMGLVVAACGTESAVLEDTVSSTSTTDPPAEDDAVFARIEALVRDAQAVVDQLHQDPEAADDPQDPTVLELDSFHTSDSTRLEALMDDLQGLAEDGHRHEPREGRPFTEVVLFDTEILNEDTVQFQYCSAQDIQVRDADDELVEPLAMLTFGDAEARRVDGKWLIHEMEPWREIELTPGYVQARECLVYDLDAFPSRADRADDEDSDGKDDENNEEDKGKDEGE